MAATALVTQLIFIQTLVASPHPLVYLVFPLLIAAAMVEGPAMTSWLVLNASAISIWHTLNGAGPFAGADARASLILLQCFMGVLAVTSLLLAAAVADRRTTEQREKGAAANLRSRQQLLRLAQRAGGVATFEWDFRNQTAHCSPEFFGVFGLPVGDGDEDRVMTGAEWGRFVHPDDRERMGRHLERALAGTEAPAADYRIITADGSVRWLSYAGQLQRTPLGDRMLGTVVDVTARVEAESALRHQRDVMSLAMRAASMGAWSRNVATNEVWWSRELEELFGLEPDAFTRTETGFFEFVHEDDRQAVRTAVDDALQRQSDYVVEFRFRHSSGEVRWMEGRGRAVYGPDGAPRTLYGIGMDVTDRKRAELALREAKLAAESANQLKDQFLATLSHELRTPLNAILGYGRMLQTNAIAPDKRPRAIDVIVRNAVLQNQLVEDLLDMSRITTGKVRLDPAPVPAISILREAVEGIKPAADAKGITLVSAFDEFAGSITADGTRLQQVFWNLLTNAVKFTGQNGRIHVSLRRDGRHVVATVSDTGAGISPDFLPFVFEPFRQGESRLARAHGGLGLGLAIAKQLVELHGGTIHASSEGVGAGATFEIRLPCVDQLQEEGRSPREPRVGWQLTAASGSLHGVKVLLVDDEQDTLSMFRDTLEAAGADVVAAATGQAAVQALNTWQPDLLVTDLALPGMDGYELLAAVRQQTRKELPAVAVSAYARLDDRARALAAGFQEHVAKPVDPADLIAALQRATVSMS
jgi:PAS domain S-box-containing protein